MLLPGKQKYDTLIKDPKNNDPFINKVKNVITKLAETEGGKILFTEEFYNDCRSIDDVKFKIYTYSLQSGCSVDKAEKRAEVEAGEIWQFVREFLKENSIPYI